MTIKILNPKVISQIAAGEVIERPASVVKELMENSLDAGATQISVEIKGGGISLIRVADNGAGIADNEAELAFERHATSKIDTLADLQRISSLGFRGEALPSIAAVAQVQMVTNIHATSSGTYLSIDDGKVVQHLAQAHPPGTTITVRNLFRKIPARLKFLKSEQVEAGRIADTVSQYALAYPEVRFTLTSDGKTNLRTPGNGKLVESITAVYGLSVAQQMLEVKGAEKIFNGEETAISVTGMVSSPQISRTNRDYLSFFVNRRWVNSRTLAFAVEEAYHGLLMQGKHPFAILSISLPSHLIDVNVHPAKMEIKFQNERAIFSLIQRAVRQALVQTSPVHRVEEEKSSFKTPSMPLTVSQSPDKMAASVEVKSSPFSETVRPALLISLPLLRVLGQFASNYIVAEGQDGLYLVDQHAAHERIMFEKIQTQRSNRNIEIQGLLEPVSFEVEPKQSAVMRQHLDELASFGFNIEDFGNRTYLVRTVPAALRERDWLATLKESLSDQTANWSEHLAITLACHSAIRAGQILNDAEMRELLKQLEQTAVPHSCPHGRPTMIQLTTQQIGKEFGRT